MDCFNIFKGLVFILALERSLANQHLIKNDAEGPEISFVRGRLVQKNLRSDVFLSSDKAVDPLFCLIHQIIRDTGIRFGIWVLEGFPGYFLSYFGVVDFCSSKVTKNHVEIPIQKDVSWF